MACPHGKPRKKCKPCVNAYNKVWYGKNSTRRKKMVAKNVTTLRRRKKILINKIKSKRCKGCRRKFPWYVMEFDHVRGRKVADIATMLNHMGASLKRILDEIEKCDVVCSNCHRRRTWRKIWKFFWARSTTV